MLSAHTKRSIYINECFRNVSWHIGLITLFWNLYRYLVIAKSSDPPIVRLDITSFETQGINFDGSAQALSVDQDNEVVYWVDFVDSTDKHYLMRSSYTGQTVPLNISYDGEIDLAQDYMHLYVLDKENNRIDKYNKRIWVKINVFNIDGPQRLIVAFGEYLLLQLR